MARVTCLGLFLVEKETLMSVCVERIVVDKLSFTLRG